MRNFTVEFNQQEEIFHITLSLYLYEVYTSVILPLF